MSDPKIQAYVSSENGLYFDVSFNEGIVSFKMIELEEEDIIDLFDQIMRQVALLQEAYHSLDSKVIDK